VDALQGFNGYLYIGMEAQGKGAVIYRSANGDRGTWQTAGTPVFGPASGRFISDASTVIGNTLYVSTMDSARGVGVWGTVDGVTWVRLAPPGFGNMATFAAELTGFNGRLYAWTSNYTSGPGVWRGEPAAGKP
jgi:hypothetical protein